MKDTMYTLTLNEKQADVLNHALELFSRLKAGQLQELWHLCATGKQDRQEFEDIASKLKTCLFPELTASGSHGVGQGTFHGDDRGDVAWDLHEVVRHRLAWSRAGNPSHRDYKKMLGHNYDKPTSWSGEPLAEMVEVKRKLSDTVVVGKCPECKMSWHLCLCKHEEL